MLKRITFTASDNLIEMARLQAAKKHTTLNAEFRRWLEQYTDAPLSATELETLMDRLKYARSGHQIAREIMNDR